MGNVLPLDEDAYQAAMAWLVLRRIRRRQDALRRRWYELSREDVEAELLAIGQELVEAASLFLRRSIISGGRPAGYDNGKAPSRNGHYLGPAGHAGPNSLRDSSDASGAQRRRRREPGPCGPEEERLDALVSYSEGLLDELERLVRELQQGGAQAEA